MQQPQQPHKWNWREAAIAKSEMITDVWEVSKAWAGRGVGWVLFFCMVANILEVAPGIKTPILMSNVVLGTQAITLDIAGFGLASLADHARENGNEKAANQAKLTSWALIFMMMLTLVLVSVKVLSASSSNVVHFVDNAEPILVFVRVVMVVISGYMEIKLRKGIA